MKSTVKVVTEGPVSFGVVLPGSVCLSFVYGPTSLDPVPKLAGATDAMVCFGMTIRAKCNEVSRSVITVVTVYVMNVWLNVLPAIGVLTFIMCSFEYVFSQVWG